ncbi:hypothetical protein MNBD_ALPHA03-2097 [hydrothermal vent metagenome]|uniref:Uncharacterized protein n=1 Tax=hydrothermal vent metagenome TaxID=652676 RepID=A0A3B1APW7_9ZZZZ
MFTWLREKISNYIIRYLHTPVWKYESFSVIKPTIESGFDHKSIHWERKESSPEKNGAA